LPTDFTLDQFRKQFAQMTEVGISRDQLPGMPDQTGKAPEPAIRRIQGIIDAMTAQERRDPEIIDLGRRRRIAAGSGVRPQEVRQFLQQFAQVRVLLRQMARMRVWE
jgi:signal recognition particle subunit SRP54